MSVSIRFASLEMAVQIEAAVGTPVSLRSEPFHQNSMVMALKFQRIGPRVHNHCTPKITSKLCSGRE